MKTMIALAWPISSRRIMARAILYGNRKKFLAKKSKSAQRRHFPILFSEMTCHLCAEPIESGTNSSLKDDLVKWGCAWWSPVKRCTFLLDFFMRSRSETIPAFQVLLSLLVNLRGLLAFLNGTVKEGLVKWGCEWWNRVVRMHLTTRFDHS